MFCQFQGDHRAGDGEVSELELESKERRGNAHTFVSTNLLIVARISWWPETSSRVFGRYFSTLSEI